jgi:hypothetical protein
VVRHSGEHCVLSALFALSAPHAQLPAVRMHGTLAPPPTCLAPSAPDATAQWVARLKHGPPRFA